MSSLQTAVREQIIHLWCNKNKWNYAAAEKLLSLWLKREKRKKQQQRSLHSTAATWIQITNDYNIIMKIIIAVLLSNFSLIKLCDSHLDEHVETSALFGICWFCCSHWFHSLGQFKLPYFCTNRANCYFHSFEILSSKRWKIANDVHSIRRAAL